MIEPVLGVSLPDHLAIPMKNRRGREGGISLLVLAQTYDNVQAQQYLAEVCRRAAGQAGVRLIAVEGAEDRLASPTPAASGEPPGLDSIDLRPEIARLIAAASELSAGALALQRREPDRFELWGVDDRARIERSQQAMIRVIGNHAARDAAFAAISPILAAAQRRVYGPALAAMRMETMPFAARRASIADQVAAITAESGRIGVDLAAFPSVEQFAELGARERRTNPARVTRQRNTFIARVTGGLMGWFQHRGGSVVTIDRGKLEPVLEYWWEKTGGSRAEFDRMIAARGLEPALLELKRWIETWLAMQAQQAGAGESHAFYEELMRLALRLGVPYFDLRDFREHVAMARHVDALKRNLPDEIASAVRELAVRSSPPAGAALFDVEARLEWLFRALCLEVPANEAEVADLTSGSLVEIVEAIAGQAGIPLNPDARSLVDALGPSLADAATFLRESWERGRIMATRTLERVEELGEDRALLVAGGFHTRAITHVLEAKSDVSWSVLAPSPDLGERAGKRRLLS